MGLRKPSGELIWISINTAPLIRSGDTRPYAVVASFFDITEHRRAEQAAGERATLSELEAGIGRNLGGGDSLNEALANSLQQLVEALGLAMSRIWLLTERDPEHLQLAAVHGFDPSMEGVYARVPVNGPLKISLVAREQRVLISNDLPGDHSLPMSAWEERERVKAFAGYPLVADGRLLGVLAFFHRQPFSEELLGGFSRLAERLSLGLLRRQGEEQIRRLNSQLEQRVAERTADLERRVHEVETLNRSMINLLEDLQHARDTAEKTARQIEVANQRLRSANEELESFSYSVSHDLRAPLRNVSGFVDLLRKKLEGRLEEGPARYMKIIQDEATRMGQLIDDLLEFSRLGRAQLRGEAFPMAELVREVLSSVPGSQAAEWTVHPLPDARGDRNLLRQVWVNLLGNAIKYSRGRRPARIEIGALAPVAGASEVVYYVRDNGVGFDMKYLDKLFGVFQRLHSGSDFEGTGIGLANVQRIVHRHGGRVWAEGAVGSGAVFYFALPVGPA